MVTAGNLPFRENSYGRTGNRTRDLMISSQRLWPLDHEAGLASESKMHKEHPFKGIQIQLINQTSWSPFFKYKKFTNRKVQLILFLIFRRVLNVIYSFLGNSPASEF